MSKSKLKKALEPMSKEEITAFILDLYERSSSIKEYFDTQFNPSAEKKLLERYKKELKKEFYPSNPMNATHSFANAKKAIKAFKEVCNNPFFVGELMMDIPELTAKFTHDYGDMWAQYYISSENNFEAALKYLQKHDLLGMFQHRAQNCVKYAAGCGWGYADEMESIYYEYYQKE